MLGVIVLALVGLNSVPCLADGPVGEPGSLALQVFQYLDSTDVEEGDRLLHDILAHPEASVERVMQIIETGRIYEAGPAGHFQMNMSLFAGGPTHYPCRFRRPMTPQRALGWWCACMEPVLAATRISNGGERGWVATISWPVQHIRPAPGSQGQLKSSC